MLIGLRQTFLVYRAVNGIFAKIGRLASEEVILQLITLKCVPILLYGLGVCALTKKLSRLTFQKTVY